MPHAAKICPIFIVRPLLEKRDIRELDHKEGTAADCLQQRCAWWVKAGAAEEGMCAMASLGATPSSLQQIIAQLQQLVPAEAR